MQIPQLSPEGTQALDAILGRPTTAIDLNAISAEQTERILLVLEAEWDRSDDPMLSRAISECAAAIMRWRRGS